MIVSWYSRRREFHCRETEAVPIWPGSGGMIAALETMKRSQGEPMRAANAGLWNQHSQR